MNKNEMKDDILIYLQGFVEYWDSLPRLSTKDRLNGVVFSILTMIDGESDFDTMKIVAEGITINDGDLHELWSKYK